MNIRDAINKNPMVGWAVAATLMVVAAGYIVFRPQEASAEMTSRVTVLFTDTNEEVEMRRGQLEMELLTRAGTVDASKGIQNPKTGAFSGVIVNKEDWKRTVEKLNAMKAAAAAQSKSGGNGNSSTAKPK